MKILMGLALSLCSAAVAAPQTLWQFDWRVTPRTLYSEATGYGFLRLEKPQIFAAQVPEGNYRVTLTLGDAKNAANTTVKAEARRLMLENVATQAGELVTRSFLVNVRRAEIAGGGRVSIREREIQSPTWDDRLTLEFNGDNPAVSALKIEKIDDATTIFIAGDSTVTDQANEPYVGWGQMLPRFFNERVAIANYAESGRALYSFKGEHRLEKILSVIKPNDYLLIQFGHNDQKDKSPGSGPFTSYKTNLKYYIAQTRAKGAIPVIITPMERRRWKENAPQQTLSDFAQAAREAAKEENAPLLDLHAMSLQFYGSLGPKKSLKAFVHYPANTFPEQKEALKDDTHFNAYGAYELARCIVEGIKTNLPDLAKNLAHDVAPFDPTKPDSVEAVIIPSSPLKPVVKPAGN